MLRTLKISNYQSHKNTRLDFMPGVNIIVGSSDCGKTAILRALYWCIYNKPSGDAFRSDWGGSTEVELLIDSDIIIRLKDTNINQYKLNSNIFKAFGQDAPSEIKSAINLNDINFQLQLSSPFLLSSDWSPGRVAEYLNEVAGLDAIDRAQANIDSVIRKIKADLGYAESQVAANAEKLAALDYVGAMEDKVRVCEAEAALVGRVRAAEQDLHNCVADARQLHEQIAGLPDYSGAEKTLFALTAKKQAADSAHEDWADINDTLASIWAAQDRLVECKKTTAAAQRTDDLLADCETAGHLRRGASELQALVDDVLGINKSLGAYKKTARAERLLNYTVELTRNRNQFDASRVSLESVLGSIYELGEIIENEGGKLKRLEAHWLQVAPDTCPLCAGTGRLK